MLSLLIEIIPGKYWKSIVLEENDIELALDNDFLHSISQKRIVFFRGWLFRNSSLVEKHADKIRSYFAPKEKYMRNVLDLITGLRKSCEILVGVHIRHGDYRIWRGGEYFYDVDTYVQIMRRVENLFPGKKVGFLICSEESQDKSKFSDFIFKFSNGLVDDMYSLSQCDYIIGPLSSFNRWASFYGHVPLLEIVNPNDTISIDRFSHSYLDFGTLPIIK